MRMRVPAFFMAAAAAAAVAAVAAPPAPQTAPLSRSAAIAASS